MAETNYKIDISVTGLDVPLMIIVDDKGKTVVFEHGEKVKNLQRVYFKADIGEVPTYTLDKFVK